MSMRPRYALQDRSKLLLRMASINSRWPLLPYEGIQLHLRDFCELLSCGCCGVGPSCCGRRQGAFPSNRPDAAACTPSSRQVHKFDRVHRGHRALRCRERFLRDDVPSAALRTTVHRALGSNGCQFSRAGNVRLKSTWEGLF